MIQALTDRIEKVKEEERLFEANKNADDPSTPSVYFKNRINHLKFQISKINKLNK